MKNKSLIVIFVLFLMFGLSINVNADSSGELDISSNTSPYLSVYKQKYNAGPPTVKITSGQELSVDVYGKSICYASSKTCDWSYYGLGNKGKVDEYFKKYVVCTGGETSVGYSNFNAATAGSYNYKGTYKATNYNLEEDTDVYWFETYTLYCLGDGESNSEYPNSVELENTGSDTGNNNNDDDGDNNVDGDDDGYVSDDGNTDNPDSGVLTYYAVLGVIAVVSYILLIAAKKFNLFKKI